MDNKKLLKILDECVDDAEIVMNDNWRGSDPSYRKGRFFGMVVLRSRIQSEIEKEKELKNQAGKK